MFLTPFLRQLQGKIAENGGGFNAHLHLDRADTACLSIVAASKTLQQKHLSIQDIHGSGMYSPHKIAERVLPYIEFMQEIGTVRADTFVDVAQSIGLAPMSTMQKIKENTSLDLRLGAYCPFGFKESDFGFDEIFKEAVERSDFIGALPERDEKKDYPDHIGFENSCLKVLLLGAKYDKPVHIHVDQKNIPGEGGTQRALSVIEETGALPPEIWLIHAISLSAETEDIFYQTCERLVNADVGIICCPSAALSMFQDRKYSAPIHNSIARVADMIRAGVKIRIGSDNVTDMFLPATSPDMISEILTLANAVRCYDVDLLARLASTRAAPIPKL
jgi:hypothetical protein